MIPPYPPLSPAPGDPNLARWGCMGMGVGGGGVKTSLRIVGPSSLPSAAPTTPSPASFRPCGLASAMLPTAHHPLPHPIRSLSPPACFFVSVSHAYSRQVLTPSVGVRGGGWGVRGGSLLLRLSGCQAVAEPGVQQST